MRVPVRLAAGARRSDNGVRPCVLHGGTPLSGCVPVSDGGRACCEYRASAPLPMSSDLSAISGPAFERGALRAAPRRAWQPAAHTRPHIPGRADARRCDAARVCVIHRNRAPRCRTSTVLHRTTTVPRCIVTRRRSGAKPGADPLEHAANRHTTEFSPTWHGACVVSIESINGDWLAAPITDMPGNGLPGQRRPTHRVSTRDRVRRTPFLFGE